MGNDQQRFNVQYFHLLLHKITNHPAAKIIIEEGFSFIVCLSDQLTFS